MKKRYYMIGNAHLDPVWMWRWQEGCAEAKATVRSALDRMKEYPDFKFVCSSASIYEWIEETAPEMFEEIKERIKEGRWIVVGGWWVQPDCNLPSGEGFARQSLYSQRYFKEKLGVTAKVGYCVDSFGHNRMIPQILRRSGMEDYIFMRPAPHENPLDYNLFLWESPDGSQVTTIRIPDPYCFNFEDEEKLDARLNFLADHHKDGEDSTLCLYGVGNHGGGPTIRNIETTIAYRKAHPETELIFADPKEYFDAVDKSVLPVHTDDLQHHASGCYAATSKIKTAIRKCETRLLAAEKYTVLAGSIAGVPYPTAKLENAWKNVLFLHFHDIAGGCAIGSSYDDSIEFAGEALSTAAKVENRALQAISWKIDTRDREKGLPIVIFNPHAFAVTADVTVNKQWDTITDSNGVSVPCQHVVSETHACYRRCDTLFRAEIPALGYVTYYAKEAPAAENKDSE
ncbi:MAG: alpha-mannosidase, partial [Clostridia bacterium]|nr:alpha-mannosidase [Clostridia bacterium]